MTEREASIPASASNRIPEAHERLVKLYEAQGNASDAAAWRSRLEAAQAKPQQPGASVSK